MKAVVIFYPFRHIYWYNRGESAMYKFFTLVLSLLSPRCCHSRTSRPITLGGKTYAACLSCGKELPYDWAGMGMGEKINPPRLTAPRQTILDKSEQYALNRTAAAAGAGVKQ